MAVVVVLATHGSPLQSIARVVEVLLDDVDSYIDNATGKGAIQQARHLFLPRSCLFLPLESHLLLVIVSGVSLVARAFAIRERL